MAGFYGRTGIEFGDDLTENLEALALVIRPAAVQAVTEAADIAREAAYGYANVSPGVTGHGVNGEHMRDEIKVTVYDYPDGVSARVQIDMSIIPYAAHQEFGARGNGFMRRAFDENRDAMHAKQREVFSAYIGKDGKFKSAVRFRRFA